MVVAAGGAGEDHAVRVEGGGGDGRAAVLLQEARVRLHARQLPAVEVEYLDCVRGCAAVFWGGGVG